MYRDYLKASLFARILPKPPATAPVRRRRRLTDSSKRLRPFAGLSPRTAGQLAAEANRSERVNPSLASKPATGRRHTTTKAAPRRPPSRRSSGWSIQWQSSRENARVCSRSSGNTLRRAPRTRTAGVDHPLRGAHGISAMPGIPGPTNTVENRSRAHLRRKNASRKTWSSTTNRAPRISRDRGPAMTIGIGRRPRRGSQPPSRRRGAGVDEHEQRQQAEPEVRRSRFRPSSPGRIPERDGSSRRRFPTPAPPARRVDPPAAGSLTIPRVATGPCSPGIPRTPRPRRMVGHHGQPSQRSMDRLLGRTLHVSRPRHCRRILRSIRHRRAPSSCLFTEEVRRAAVERSDIHQDRKLLPRRLRESRLPSSSPSRRD